MQVKVTSITKSLIEGKELSAEDLIVYTARVSNPSNQLNTDTSEKLLKYLITNKHWSPFDMVHFAVEVKTSRAIAAQILRHWSFDFQEFSQRYAEAVDFEPIQLREAGSTTRQGSKEGEYDPYLELEYDIPVSDGVAFYFPAAGKASEIVEDTLTYLKALYRAMLKAGIAKEVARMILPLTTQTTLYMNASVRNWMFYFSQRLDPHAQLEHRQLAEAIYPLFETNFPTITKSFFL